MRANSVGEGVLQETSGALAQDDYACSLQAVTFSEISTTIKPEVNQRIIR